MSSVLADFTAWFNAEADQIDRPRQGRVLLGKDQLVLAASPTEQVTVPLATVTDIHVDYVPEVFDPLPGTPVTVAFTQQGRHAVALIASDTPIVKRFTTVLFRAVLNGIPATIKHPARRGGRVLDTDVQRGRLSLSDTAVWFETAEGPVTIALDAVIDFSRETRTLTGEGRPVLVVTHIPNQVAITTLAAIASARKLRLLGRFLRLEYQTLVASLAELSLSEIETEVLTALYATGEGNISLGDLLDISPADVTRTLHALHDNGLIKPGESGPVLTPVGHVVVTQYLERVNG